MSRYSTLRKRRRLFPAQLPYLHRRNPSRTRRSRIVSSLFRRRYPSTSVLSAVHLQILLPTFLSCLITHPNFLRARATPPNVKEAMNVNPDGFLLPDEEKLVHHIIREHEPGFAWEESEKGQFSSAYFDDVVIPTIEHLPWTLRNIPSRLASMIASWR